jgi:hypothetical protein
LYLGLNEKTMNVPALNTRRRADGSVQPFHDVLILKVKRQRKQRSHESKRIQAACSGLNAAEIARAEWKINRSKLTQEGAEDLT